MPQNAASDQDLHCLLKLQEVKCWMKQSSVHAEDHFLSLHSETINQPVLSVLWLFHSRRTDIFLIFPSKCIKGWSQDCSKSDGCFSQYLISSPWRCYEDYNISFCKQWKFRCYLIMLVWAMAPEFTLFTKESKLPLNKGFKNMFQLLQSCAQPSNYYVVGTHIKCLDEALLYSLEAPH